LSEKRSEHVSLLINTQLQLGAYEAANLENRFNGFPHFAPAEATNDKIAGNFDVSELLLAGNR
jgi:hypothetical protein